MLVLAPVESRTHIGVGPRGIRVRPFVRPLRASGGRLAALTSSAANRVPVCRPARTRPTKKYSRPSVEERAARRTTRRTLGFSSDDGSTGERDETQMSGGSRAPFYYCPPAVRNRQVTYCYRASKANIDSHSNWFVQRTFRSDSQRQ